MRTSLCWLAMPALMLVGSVRSQSSDVLNSFISEAYSVYTEVTSILASDAQNTASATSSSQLITSTTSSFLSSTSTSASSPASSASLAATAATASSTPLSGSHAKHHNNLAIILGAVLGALVLGLLILCLVLCCYCRRKRSAKHRPLSPADDEVDSWRVSSRDDLNSHGDRMSGHGIAGRDRSMAAAATGPPDMAEHPAFKNGTSHENPFVPVPPPPRRTAPNSRAGLTDGTIPGEEPFIAENSRGVGPIMGNNSDSSLNRRSDHHRGTLAAGAGGAALGAAALHHHEKTHNNRDLENSTLKRHSGSKGSLLRKPLPDSARPGRGSGVIARNGTNISELEASSPTMPSTDARTGLDQSRDVPSLSPFTSAGHARTSSQEPLMSEAAAAGVGAVGGAALADHHRRPSPHKRDSDSGFFSGSEQHDSYRSGEYGRRRSSGTPTQSHHMMSTLPPDYSAIPTNHTSRSTPPLPPLSTIAPAAALGAHPGTPRGTSPANNGDSRMRQTRTTTPPAVPSRSPKRTRFSDLPYDVPGSNPASASTSHNNSDDSTFRLSSSIPGGWRNSADSDRHLRNSGINPNGRSPRGSFDGATAGPGALDGVKKTSRNGEGPRLSDLRAEEEEKERAWLRGRGSGAGSLSHGYGQDDGLDEGYYGVGQAL